MHNDRHISIEEIEKSALYNDREKMSLSSSFARKDDFKRQLAKLEYNWNLIAYPKEVIKLLRDYTDIGMIYILTDDRLRASLSSYTETIIQIMEEKGDTEVYTQRMRKTAKDLEETLLPYFHEFCKSITAGVVVFHIIIKYMLSEILKTEIREIAGEFVHRIEAEVSKVTNTVLSFLIKRSKLAFDEKTKLFLERVLQKIPVLACPISNLDANELNELLASKELSLLLFTKVNGMFFDQLRETAEKNLLQSLLSHEVHSKQELLDSIEIPLSKHAADEIITTMKQSVSKKLAAIEQKRLDIEKEIDQGFEGFEETCRTLWESIQTEVAGVKDGTAIGDIDEIADRSNVLSIYINKRLWSIRSLLIKKKKLDRSINHLRQLESVSKEELVEHSEKVECQPRVSYFANLYFAFVKHYGKTSAKIPSSITSAAEKILKQAEKEDGAASVDPFIEKHFLAKNYRPDRLILRFLSSFEDTIIPLYLQDALMSFFVIWPPPSIEQKGKELPRLEKEILYVGDYLIPENKYFKLGTLPLSVPNEPYHLDDTIVSKLVDNYSSVATVLIYDIRGSTFMGMKLGSAKIESSIRRKFGERMLEIAEKYGAFPIKDTGDGGILLFSQNSGELYGKIFAPARIGTEWMRSRFQKEDLEPTEGEESSKMAVLAAKEMILAAQKFVSENMGEYGDWFKEEKEQKLFFKGMNYGQLPPSYKRIFQIGIGISSGHLGKDLYFSVNAYGDPDITGNLVRDANLYSKARDPDSSVILMDSASLLNLLLNEELIEPVVEERKVGGFSETEIYRYIIDKTVKLAQSRSKRVAYKLKDYGLIIKRIGYRILEAGKEERIIPSINIPDLDLVITDSGALKYKKGETVKFLYEVSVEG
jgi:hypothetical protein